jgi:outer membrane receptor protein involved in Fe transport
MGNNRNLRFAIRAALATAAAAATFVPTAQSQTASTTASTAPADTGLAEVVVTGSRLQQSPNDISISPITSVTQVEIQQTGLVRVEDLLNSLPNVTAEFSSAQSISSNGTATVSLYGLGSQRTLVLVDGFRLSPGAGLGAITSSSADLNQVPADLIQRVDVLTGGASSVYGADAVAGVVNFVLNTHFQGVEIDGNYGYGHHSNNNSQDLGYLAAANDFVPPSGVNIGFTKDLSIIMGSDFADGRGNATAYFTYLNQEPVVGSQLDYAGCTLNTPSGGGTTGPLHCGGSGTSATGQFLVLGNTGKATKTIVDSTVDKHTGAFRNYNPTTDDYNYGGLSYIQREAQRYTAGTFINFDVNDNANVYSEFMFSRNTSTALYGPSGAFFANVALSCTDPLLNAQEFATLCNPTTLAQNQAAYGTSGNTLTLYIARRSVESGGREDNYTSNSFHEVLGVKGKFADAFSYNAYAQIGLTQMSDNEGDYLGTQQVANALNVVPNPATGGIKGVATGAPVCASALNGSDTACVPWNVWTPGGVNQAQLNYLEVASTYGITATEYIAHADLSGDLGKYGVQLPTASTGASMNVGAEYRQERYQFSPDYIFQNGLADGGDGIQNPVDGGFHLWEVFAEAKLPIANDRFLLEDLNFEGGYRYSAYTTGYDTNTFKLGLNWSPIKDIKFRGGYNRAVRAPSVGDLYTPQSVGAGGAADPCWGPAVNGLVQGHTLQYCENTGVTQPEFGNILVNGAAQINTSSGGNSALTPEIADTYTFGFVFAPTFLPKFNMSIDYYEIHIKNAIEDLSSTQVISACGETGAAASCDLIHRGAGGSLWLAPSEYVELGEVNIGQISTRGIDLAAAYNLDMGAGGKIGFNIKGTETINFLDQPIPGGPKYDCAGYAGVTCGSPTPHWRHVFSSTWGAPWAGLDITARWRYIGPVDVDSSSQNPDLAGSYYLPTAHIGGYSYIDLSASIPIATSGVSVRVGVNNLADKTPPTVANGSLSACPTATCNDNTWAGTYDTLGRYMYAHVTAKF